MMIQENLRIETERLILRGLQTTDVEAVIALANDYDIASNLLTMPHPYTRKDAEEFIASAGQPKENGLVLAITNKVDNAFMGNIGIHANPEHHHAEIGYWLGKPYWGQGYMTEAVRRMIGLGFEKFDLNRIYAHHYTRNPASGRVLEKAGMTYEGVLRQHYFRFGAFEDVACYSILRSEYQPE